MKREGDCCDVFLQVNGDFDLLMFEEWSSEEEMIEKHAEVIHLVDECILRSRLEHDLLVEETMVIIVESELFVSELL